MKEEFNATKKIPVQKCRNVNRKNGAMLFFFNLLAKRSSLQINRAAILIKEEIKTSVRNSSESDHITTSE